MLDFCGGDEDGEREKTGQRTAKSVSCHSLDVNGLYHRVGHKVMCASRRRHHSPVTRAPFEEHPAPAHPSWLCYPTFVVDSYSLQFNNHRLISLMNDILLDIFRDLPRTRLSISDSATL